MADPLQIWQICPHRKKEINLVLFSPEQDETNGFDSSPSDIIVHVTHLI